MNTTGIDEAAAMYVVVSDMDGGAYGPFFIHARALEYAEAVNGTVFRLVDDGAGGVK
jgi:hypothetical protein